MKVKDLIEALKNHDQEKEVLIAMPSGDFWKNTVAQPVENVTALVVSWSVYHDKWKVGGERSERRLSAVVISVNE